ncbi:MAG: glutamine-hydrolyzing carbamoyl-phosphate synthase small subunit [Alistipes sp.]|jgi:carbamoyl-phosphate synthase small subunit|nr:glutamine-hydrolyzing carbamoyl-phosphate synthase small subunit [Alistipes sp.]
MSKTVAVLSLADGTKFTGFSFGAELSVRGEVVFNTSMTGWPELLSDPGLRGQILVLTYPLIGNYGVPPRDTEGGLMLNFESEEVQIAGLVVTDYSEEFSHWNAAGSLAEWLRGSGVPAIFGVDTRELAKHLRERGELEGAIEIEGAAVKPASANRIADVSIARAATYGEGDVTVALLDTGVRHNVIRSLVRRGVKVLRLPWDADIAAHEWDGLVLVDAPDDPSPVAGSVARALAKGRPVLGVGGGDKLLALAAGGAIRKLEHSHRGANQPVIEAGTSRAQITVQNRSWTVDAASLPEGWSVWFENLNDGSVEGIRHEALPFRAVAWHPEATNRPEEADRIYDEFIETIRRK